ncbi:MAG: hypothetical protein EOP09_02800, partial [Proteobacteria bacterium]
MRAFVAIISGLLFSMQAHAAGADRIPGARYPSARGSGMGDSLLGFADDAQGALFYNPAMFGKIKSANLEPLNFKLSGNLDLIRSLGVDSYKYSGRSKYIDYLLAHRGDKPSHEFAVFPNITLPGFGFGLLYQSRTHATGIDPNYSYKSRTELIPTLGTGFRLASGVLRFGYSLQWVNRTEGQGTVSFASNSASVTNETRGSGSGFSHNGGMTVTLPYMYQPSFQFVARN